MTQIIEIYFGEMGAGKSYHAKRVAEHPDSNAVFFEGDSVATTEMIDRVSKFKLLNPKIIATFVSKLVDSIIDKAQEVYPKKLIVSQALYCNFDRMFIRKLLRAYGYEVNFVWVRASFWRNIKQLYSRPNGLKWIYYYLINKPFFEKPTHSYLLLKE